MHPILLLIVTILLPSRIAELRCRDMKNLYNEQILTSRRFTISLFSFPQCNDQVSLVNWHTVIHNCKKRVQGATTTKERSEYSNRNIKFEEVYDQNSNNTHT